MGDQRGFLTYLWWETDNLEGDLLDYEMCVHVFGGTSSPVCCYYALRKTAVGNVSDFKVGVAETLMNNFCVDNLLKSVDNLLKIQQSNSYKVLGKSVNVVVYT